MPAKDTFFLRKTIDTSTSNFVSGDIDISAYTDPARGRVLVVDRAFVTYMSDGNGPILGADVGAGVMRTVGIQVTSESKTALVDANDNSLIESTNELFNSSLFSICEANSSFNVINSISSALSSCFNGSGNISLKIISSPRYFI